MMTRRCLFLVSIALLGSRGFAAEEAAVDGADNPLLRPPAPEVTEEQILEAYGYVLGRDFSDRLQLFSMFYSFGFSDEDFAIVMRGMGAAFQGKGEPVDMDLVGPQLRTFLDSRPEAVRQARLAAGRAEQAEALASLDAREEIKKTESGLRYEIKDPGTGEKPSSDSVVIAHYRGTFVDGSEFDNSLKFGEPVRFAMKDVIPGWQEGLQMIAPGGHIVIFTPAELAYGDTGLPPIPPGKMLVFQLELVAIEPPDAEAPESSTPDSGEPGSTDATPQTAAP